MSVQTSCHRPQSVDIFTGLLLKKLSRRLGVEEQAVDFLDIFSVLISQRCKKVKKAGRATWQASQKPAGPHDLTRSRIYAQMEKHSEGGGSNRTDTPARGSLKSTA